MISQSNKPDKQKELLSAALKLFVEYGFHGTPTSKIAQEAGVANGTLFHYYKTKDDLVVAIYTDIKMRMNTEAGRALVPGNSLEANLRSMFYHTLRWALDNGLEFRFLQQFHSSPFVALVNQEMVANESKYHVKLLNEGISTGLIKDLPVDFIHTLLTSHIFGVYQYLASSQFGEEEKEKLIGDSFNMIWDMIT